MTERDFAYIADKGLNAIRIPVPYFIFGDVKPFVGCVEYLDKAFNWAEKYGLQILIDLHTAPGSQNGFDNGGICGVCKWGQNPEEVEFVLNVLERLAQRYGNREGL
ncbi:glycoside hydrolase family 5 protein [Paenibacillus sp. E222]|uniref:glycoside hydrolase family 5 protein n=1 Tax=Paenibacillus sp. E222 TaxID=2748863 RepID=UPI00211BA36F|nr:cellulase family glycosylhydrolase [Paenibacillus sp. E222]